MCICHFHVQLVNRVCQFLEKNATNQKHVTKSKCTIYTAVFMDFFV